MIKLGAGGDLVLIIKHIRHGSHLITYQDKTFLIDPMFSDKGTMAAIPKGRVKEKNPLVDLPFELDFLDTLDGVIITHNHFDHFDKVAMTLLPKDLRVMCHKRDVSKIQNNGFTNVVGFENTLIVDNTISLVAVGGHHGTGLVGTLMGRTTGYILSDISDSPFKEPTVYIVGDSIWCDEVEWAIDAYKPEVVTVYAGEARMPFGKPITMSTWDIEAVLKKSDEAVVVALHMDAINHCYLTREMLREHLVGTDIEQRVVIPEDGQPVTFEKRGT